MSAPVTGVHRVAAFLLSLDPDVAKRVIGHLAPDVVEAVAQAMLELPNDLDGAAAADDLHRQIALALHGPKRLRACADGDLARILTGALGAERAEKVLARIRERRMLEQPFSELERANPYALGTVLRSESPAVAALVMAHLSPAFSAACLGAFDHDVALDVVKRMATITPPPYATLRIVADRLAKRMQEAAANPTPADGKARLKTVAELLSNSEAEMERGVLEAIGADDAGMAAEIREFLFTWEDIGTIDKRSMQKILGAVDTKTLSLALKGASTSVEENVMNNLSQRVRDMVREEREMIGAVPLAEIMAGREEVMRSVRALIESGEFRPSRGGEELVA